VELTVGSNSESVEIDLDRVGRVLQPPATVLYAPPHVFPMSTPDFATAPEARRPTPSGSPLALYLHVPYCRYACNFCFYVKRIGAGRDEMERYVRALQREFEAIPAGTPLNQLFVGGGTPTALPPDLFDAALEAALGRMDRSTESIHTVECSPETVTPEHVAVLARHGIPRVSMGVQSVNDAVLDNVHRRHTGRDALEACERLVASGLMVNVDLIYGLPGQTEKTFRDDFEAVVGTGVHCLNIYNLRVNESTPVMRTLQDDERLELANLLSWRALVKRLAEEFGYRQTQWQRFLRKDLEFELNLTSDNLFAAGVSARSFLDGTIYRNHTGSKEYVERIEAGRSPVEEIFRLDGETRKTYHVSRTLGAGKPLNRQAYEREFGCSFDRDHGDTCERLAAAGLVTDVDGSVSMTEAGKLVWDLVTLAFYPRHLQEWLKERHALAVARRAPKRRPS
jgi:oxygen-independent coproporphyrinogen-3 oxidase